VKKRAEKKRLKKTLAERGCTNVQAWIEPALAAELDALAKRGRRSRAAEVVVAIEGHVARTAV
jgi:predicted transcriptional regulator